MKRWGLLCLVVPALSGCSELHRTVNAAKKVSDAANLRLATPEYTVAMKPPRQSLSAPIYDFFRSEEGMWGEGKWLGALWAYDPAGGATVQGLAVAGPTDLLVLETPSAPGAGQALVRLDSAGREASRAPLAAAYSSLEAGALGAGPALLARTPQGLAVLDLSGRPLWPEALPAAQAVRADLDGDGRAELVASAGGPGAVSAFAADGRRLWVREGLPQVLGLAAGRLVPGTGDGVAVFASSAGASSVLILDGQGRTAASFSDETVPEQGMFLRAEGPAAYLAHVGSRLKIGRERLRVSRLEAGRRTVVAEADLGQTRVAGSVVADFNGNGRKDLALSLEDGRVLIYDENARLMGERRYPGPAPRLAAGDINGDGFDELLVAAGENGSRVYAYGVLSKPARPKKP